MQGQVVQKMPGNKGIEMERKAACPGQEGSGCDRHHSRDWERGSCLQDSGSLGS